MQHARAHIEQVNIAVAIDIAVESDLSGIWQPRTQRQRRGERVDRDKQQQAEQTYQHEKVFFRIVL
jgi:hypothetical protein